MQSIFTNIVHNNSIQPRKKYLFLISKYSFQKDDYIHIKKARETWNIGMALLH